MPLVIGTYLESVSITCDPIFISTFWIQKGDGFSLGLLLIKLPPDVVVWTALVLKLRTISWRNKEVWFKNIVKCDEKLGALCDGITIYSVFKPWGWLDCWTGFIWL